MDVLLLILKLFSGTIKATPSRVSIHNSSEGNAHWSFALLIGAAPLIHLVIQSLVKLKKVNQHILLYFIMIGSALLFWQIRISIIVGEIRRMEGLTFGNNIQNIISFSNLNFVTYMAFGMVLGALTFFPLKKIFPPSLKTLIFEKLKFKGYT
ncbi:MAG: hypothetical protein HRT57_09725 [Crocinitomicaceae bacterium]|nr:hypothetical protein [Crocinitomicaceae bacterium]